MSFPAPEVWGLDPMFRSYVRLFICDVQNLNVRSFDEGGVQPLSSTSTTGMQPMILMKFLRKTEKVCIGYVYWRTIAFY